VYYLRIFSEGVCARLKGEELQVKVLILILTILLAGCVVTPPIITDVYRDGDDLVFHKAAVEVNTVTYQVNERDGRDIRVNIK
jgi:uncharacterized lipoprotein YajG